MTDVEFVMIGGRVQLASEVNTETAFILDKARSGTFVDRRNHTLAPRSGDGAVAES